MIDIKELKRLNPIQEVANQFEEFRLDARARGKHWRGEVHDSFVVNVDEQLYFWNSRGRGGDVISFLEQEQQMGFKEALAWLASRAGVPLHLDERTAQHLAATRRRQDVLDVIVGFLEGKLADTATASSYVERRGWTAETAEAARLGFWDGDGAGLREHLQLHEIKPEEPAAVALLGYRGDVRAWAKQRHVEPRAQWLRDGRVPGMPAGMLVYVHLAGRKPEYISARAIAADAKLSHWNPPRELMGERRPLWNHAVKQSTFVTIVEGQADAISLAQWHIPAVALAGLSGLETISRQLEDFERVYLALDADEAGQESVMAIADVLGPMTRIVRWPNREDNQVKDANDWLRAGAARDDCMRLLGEAPLYAYWLCQRTMRVEPMERDEALDKAVATLAQLPEYVYEKIKSAAAKCLEGIGIRDLNNMVRALQKTTDRSHKIELTMPNGFVDDHLFELVYDPDHEDGPRTAFAVRRPNGSLTMMRSVKTDHYRIYPLNPYDKLIQSGVLRLASDLGTYESEMALQEKIQAFIHQYVDVPPDIEKLASYYVMLSWLFDKFYVLPYLRARGDSDSGKSRFTEVVGELCLRAIFVTGSTTPSPVFRTMEKWNGLTVVMDEADLPHSETSHDWIQMLNTGYKQGFGILRTSMSNGEATVDVFSAFGPKILNMRGRFQDDATESRCLTWETSSGRGIRHDIERFIEDRDGYYQQALEIRNQLLAFRLRKWKDVEPDYNHEAMKHLPGRLVEITVPLLSITDEKAFKDSIMDFIAAMNRQAITQRAMTLPAKVLEGILRAYYVPDSKAREAPDALRLQVAHITRQANRIMNIENAEASLFDDDDEDYRRPARQLSAGRVGKLINNELNLQTEKASVGTRPMVLRWDIERINALVIRYGLEELLEELVIKENQRQQEKEDSAEASQEALQL